MPVSIDAFYGLDAATLSSLKTKYVECLEAIAVAGQSYTVAGRQFNRANIAEVSQLIAAVQSAIDRAASTSPTKTFARF